MPTSFGGRRIYTSWGVTLFCPTCAEHPLCPDPNPVRCHSKQAHSNLTWRLKPLYPLQYPTKIRTSMLLFHPPLPPLLQSNENKIWGCKKFFEEFKINKISGKTVGSQFNSCFCLSHLYLNLKFIAPYNLQEEPQLLLMRTKSTKSGFCRSKKSLLYIICRLFDLNSSKCLVSSQTCLAHK